MVGTWAPDASEPQKLRKEDTNGQTFLPSFLLRELQCWEQVKLNCQIIWSREIRIEGGTAMGLHCWDFFFQDNHQIAILLIIYLCHSIPRFIFILFIRQFQRPASLKMHLLVYCSWPLRSQVGGENIHSGQVNKERCSGAPIRLYGRWPSGPCLAWHSIVQGLQWIRATLLSCRTVSETLET